MYVADRERRDLGRRFSSVDDFLQGLGTVITVDAINSSNLGRIGQLFNKTNQFNLSTRRLTEAELVSWANTPGQTMAAFSVSDRFGDLGLTGIIGFKIEGDKVRMVDFVLSCRVMGRNVEKTMIHYIVEEARRQGAKQFITTYLPTDRNMPTLHFLRESGLHDAGDNVFTWNCAEPFPKPSSVNFRQAADAVKAA
jgi:FkbH-like protein